MNKTSRNFVYWGPIFWGVVIVLSIYIIWPLRQKLRFGIDLVGGTYITLEVQTDKAVESELIEVMQRAETKLKKENSLKRLNKQAAINRKQPDCWVSPALRSGTE